MQPHPLKLPKTFIDNFETIMKSFQSHSQTTCAQPAQTRIPIRDRGLPTQKKTHTHSSTTRILQRDMHNEKANARETYDILDQKRKEKKDKEKRSTSRQNTKFRCSRDKAQECRRPPSFGCNRPSWHVLLSTSALVWCVSMQSHRGGRPLAEPKRGAHT